jgi:replicative DNA helicase
MVIDTNFFQTLYQLCDEGNIELRTLPSRDRKFISLGQINEIGTFCNAETEGYYFGVALRSGGGTKADITQIPCLHVDCDFKDNPREILIEKVKQLPFKPSIIVKSGGGVHLYFILKEPVGQDEIPRVEDANRRLASAVGGDLKACDASRILRIPGTWNCKYNPPAKVEVSQTNDFFYELDTFLEILPEVSELAKSPKSVNGEKDWLSEAMAGVADGSRNATGTKIAGYWINKLSPSDTLTILKSWNQNNEPPLPEKEMQTIVESVSRYEPDKSRSIDLSNVYDSKRMVEEYRKHVGSLRNNRFLTGVHEIDKRIRGVAGGEVLTIIARAGSFKTAMLQNLLKNYIDNSAWAAVFFSIEMPVASVTERYFEILDGCTGAEVEIMYSDPEQLLSMQAAEAQFIKDLERLFVIPSKVSLHDIPKYISLIESEYQIKIGVVGIDYLGLLDGPGQNEYEVVSRLARGIKSTAKLINLPVIVLSQVSRKGGGGETEITLDMGRGSGAIEEGADFVLGLWQVEKTVDVVGADEPRKDYDLICRILKNRKGQKGSRWLLELDPSTLRFGSEASPYKAEKNLKGFSV